MSGYARAPPAAAAGGGRPRHKNSTRTLLRGLLSVGVVTRILGRTASADLSALAAEVAEGGAFVKSEADATPLKSRFWDGEGAHLDFTNPAAIRWWQQGKLLEIAEYCAYDVKVTKCIHEYGAKNGHVKYKDRNGREQKVDVSWTL